MQKFLEKAILYAINDEKKIKKDYYGISKGLSIGGGITENLIRSRLKKIKGGRPWTWQEDLKTY